MSEIKRAIRELLQAARREDSGWDADESSDHRIRSMFQAARAAEKEHAELLARLAELEPQQGRGGGE